MGFWGVFNTNIYGGCGLWVIIWKWCGKMWPGNSSDSDATTSFFASLCNSISSCLSVLCCCWLFKACLGRRQDHRQGPTTPLISPPPQDPMDDHLGQLGGPHTPFGMPHPPGPPNLMDDRLEHLGGPHNPFRIPKLPGPSSPINDHHRHLGGPYFEASDQSGPPSPPRPPIQHGPLAHPGPLHPYGLAVMPEPPRVPSVQPSLL